MVLWFYCIFCHLSSEIAGVCEFPDLSGTNNLFTNSTANKNELIVAELRKPCKFKIWHVAHYLRITYYLIDKFF